MRSRVVEPNFPAHCHQRSLKRLAKRCYDADLYQHPSAIAGWVGAGYQQPKLPPPSLILPFSPVHALRAVRQQLLHLQQLSHHGDVIMRCPVPFLKSPTPSATAAGLYILIHRQRGRPWSRSSIEAKPYLMGVLQLSSPPAAITQGSLSDCPVGLPRAWLCTWAVCYVLKEISPRLYHIVLLDSWVCKKWSHNSLLTYNTAGPQTQSGSAITIGRYKNRLMLRHFPGWWPENYSLAPQFWATLSCYITDCRPASGVSPDALTRDNPRLLMPFRVVTHVTRTRSCITMPSCTLYWRIFTIEKVVQVL